MKKYTRLDGGGLLFLAQKLIERIDSSRVTIDSVISADSTNESAAGSKAVFDEVRKMTVNPNLLINPDFKVNQRNVSGTFSETGKYFVDRWRLVSGSVSVNQDGTITLNGSICQPLENAVGTNVTASVSAGTAVYNNTTRTFTISANGETISWAKLEYGSVNTPFVTPDISDEMAKCLRYYEMRIYSTTSGLPAVMWQKNLNKCHTNISFFEKRVDNPTITVTGGGKRFVTNSGVKTIINYEIYAGYNNNAGVIFELEEASSVPLFGWVDKFIISIDAEIY